MEPVPPAPAGQGVGCRRGVRQRRLHGFCDFAGQRVPLGRPDLLEPRAHIQLLGRLRLEGRVRVLPGGRYVSAG